MSGVTQAETHFRCAVRARGRAQSWERTGTALLIAAGVVRKPWAQRVVAVTAAGCILRAQVLARQHASSVDRFESQLLASRETDAAGRAEVPHWLYGTLYEEVLARDVNETAVLLLLAKEAKSQVRKRVLFDVALTLTAAAYTRSVPVVVVFAIRTASNAERMRLLNRACALGHKALRLAEAGDQAVLRAILLSCRGGLPGLEQRSTKRAGLALRRKLAGAMYAQDPAWH